MSSKLNIQKINESHQFCKTFVDQIFIRLRACNVFSLFISLFTIEDASLIGTETSRVTKTQIINDCDVSTTHIHTNHEFTVYTQKCSYKNAHHVLIIDVYNDLVSDAATIQSHARARQRSCTHVPADVTVLGYVGFCFLSVQSCLLIQKIHRLISQQLSNEKVESVTLQ